MKIAGTCRAVFDVVALALFVFAISTDIRDLLECCASLSGLDRAHYAASIIKSAPILLTLIKAALFIAFATKLFTTSG